MSKAQSKKNSFVDCMREYYIVPLVIITMLVGLSLQFLGHVEWARWLLSIFSLLIAAKLVREMIGKLHEGKWGIDVLAVTAILSTVIVGEYWAAIVVVLMLSGGTALEAYANQRATHELSALLERAPSITHIKLQDGSTTDIPVIQVAVGDVLLIRPGEVIPVDAVLLDETASFDESGLTGESLPVEHTKGQELLSGSINGDWAINIRTLRTAQNSQYQQIIDLVKAASNSQAPFVRLADRYAVPFTIISFAIAGVAWIWSSDPIRFAEVLVVATPCPLILGAPIAFISGMSRAAKYGIIVKNGATLEKLAHIKTVAFDKTGTLTHGEPKVARILPVGNIDEAELLRVAASAEQRSAHILAQSLVQHAKAKHIQLVRVNNVKETTAQGVEATVANRRIIVGKRLFLEAAHLTVKTHTDDAGETAIYVGQDGKYIGCITFADEIRQNSRSTIEKLHSLGVVHTIMLTGDVKATARRIVNELDIEDMRAECSPKDKVDAIKDLTDRPVMMLGDGVNDAPVLAAADVGMAMGARGSTAASETADVVVLLDDISRSALAIQIASDTMRIALQSIWIGIVISVGLMLVASTGSIPAVIGAGLQEIVDVLVIINALRAHGDSTKSS